jgi:DNA polymerase-3 subunit beta
MKLQCPRGLLSSAFQAVSGVVPSRTPREILKKVKLQLTDGQAILIGTDQEVGVRYQIPEVQTDSAGEVLLPVQRTMAILREVQDDVIGIEVSEEAIWIRAGQSEFRLSAEDPAEFPDVPPFSAEKVFVVPERELKEGIQRTLFAADVESTRYALGGVLLDISPESLTLAATDSRRLAVYRMSCSSEASTDELPEQPVIPSKAMSLIERSLTDADTGVRISVRANDALVSAGLVTIYSRLVQGRFPRYQDVIPTESGMTVELVAGPFHSAVRQAMIVTNEESRGVDFSFETGTLTLNSQAADVGTSTVQLPISYDGTKTVVTFDPKFVSDFLKVLDPGSQVTLNLIDANSAAVFHTDEKYTYVVMPLQRD